MQVNNNEASEKQDIVIDIYFEAILNSIKRNFFHQGMFGFVDKLEFSDKKYQTNGTIRDKKI